MTWTIADRCYTTSTYSATFTIAPPAPVVVAQAVAGGANACDLVNQAAAQATFDAWLATASVSGGCAPTSTPSASVAPNFCGGATTVTWTIADSCYTTSTYSATFTIAPPAPVVVAQAVAGGANACDLVNQAAAQAAFDAWLATASVSGGCAPTSTPSTTTAPNFCGGATTVTWTIADRCYTTSTYSATFTIAPPAPVVVAQAVAGGANACDLVDQAAAQAAFDAWLATASVSGGCAPTSTPSTTTAPNFCGGATTVTWTIADRCYTTSTCFG